MVNLDQKYAFIARDHFQETLRLYKRRAGHTSCDIARLGDLSKRVVEGWLSGKSMPQFSNIMQVVVIYGTDFLNDLLRPFGYDGSREIECGEGINPFEVATINAGSLQLLIDALRDGQIDHRERKPIIQELDRLINAAQALRSDLKRKEGR